MACGRRRRGQGGRSAGPILTDKANIELPSPVTGTFLKILAQPGQIVKVGEPIALIQPAAGQAVAQHAVTPSDPPTPASLEAIKPGQETPSGKAAGVSGEVLATPVVRKLAKDLGWGWTRSLEAAPAGGSPRRTSGEGRRRRRPRASPGDPRRRSGSPSREDAG